MFMGQYSHTIDEKGRLIMPSKYREQLGSEFVITRGSDECLFIYTMDEWENIKLRAQEKSLNSKDGRRFMRMFYSSASVLEPDKQGRVLIPTLLREHAGLGKEVELIGCASRIELWDRTNWNNYMEDGDFDAVMEYVTGEGLIF